MLIKHRGIYDRSYKVMKLYVYNANRWIYDGLAHNKSQP